MNENSFVIKQQTNNKNWPVTFKSVSSVTKWSIDAYFLKRNMLGEIYYYYFFLELGVVNWSYFVFRCKGECIKVLTICEIASLFFWVSFDLIKRMVAKPLFHSFAINLCDSARRLAAFFVQNNVSKVKKKRYQSQCPSAAVQACSVLWHNFSH